MHMHPLRATWSDASIPPRLRFPKGNHRTGPRSPRQILPNRADLLFSQARRAAMSLNGAIERILEVSAEAQIKRREAAEDSRISQLNRSDNSLWQGTWPS